jgi:hypothetical protein
VSTKWQNDHVVSYAGLQKGQNADPEQNALMPALLCRAVDGKLKAVAEFGRRDTFLEMNNIGQLGKVDRYEEARKQAPFSASFQMSQ